MRIVLVEDHLAYRESFRLAVSTLSPFTVVGEATRARDAYAVIESTNPDLVVTDFMLPDTDGVSLARELRRRRVKVRMMILGRLGHPLFVRDALRAGIAGFALKREPLADLIGAMQQSGRRRNLPQPADPGTDRARRRLTNPPWKSCPRASGRSSACCWRGYPPRKSPSSSISVRRPWTPTACTSTASWACARRPNWRGWSPIRASSPPDRPPRRSRSAAGRRIYSRRRAAAAQLRRLHQSGTPRRGAGRRLAGHPPGDGSASRRRRAHPPVRHQRHGAVQPAQRPAALAHPDRGGAGGQRAAGGAGPVPVRPGARLVGPAGGGAGRRLCRGRGGRGAERLRRPALLRPPHELAARLLGRGRDAGTIGGGGVAASGGDTRGLANGLLVAGGGGTCPGRRLPAVAPALA